MEDYKRNVIFTFCIILALFPKIICSLTIAILLFIVIFYDKIDFMESILYGNKKDLVFSLSFILMVGILVFITLYNSLL